MPSLQLLQLTERGRNLVASRRKVLLFTTSILVASGTAAYVQSRFNWKNCEAFDHFKRLIDNQEKPNNVATTDGKPSKQKQRGLRSLQALALVLISRMGHMGARDLLSLVAIVVLRTVLSNRLAKVQGFLFQAAFLRHVTLFFRMISENLLLCFLLSTLYSTSDYITGTLSLRFRKILTQLIHAHYFENMAFYKISHVDGRIVNPEQRIASDVTRFCSELGELLQDDLTAAYVLGAGTMLKNLSPAFGKLTSKEQQLEGEYRQLHSRLITHSESISFFGGQSTEESRIQKKFWSLIGHAKAVLHNHWWFGIIQDFLLKYLGATVAVIFTVEPFFAGHLRPETSTLGRAEMLSNLRYHMSVISSLFNSFGKLSKSAKRLSHLSGYAVRIHELMAISRELGAENVTSLEEGHKSSSNFSEADHIEFSGVKVVTPTNSVLVKDLTLRVELGSNLLITGPNGSGKSSLFRVLGGLWPLHSGHIRKPGVGSNLNKDVYYVPQRPYTAIGTLHDQLIYPLTADQETEPLTHNDMVELLKNVDLEYLLGRYPTGKVINWSNELSLGEQQRLGMARLFYHRPKFAILDECTSAVTTDMEERFCVKVQEMGTSCITISHRPALVAFHDVVLSLNGEGGWSVHSKREVSSDVMKSGINRMIPYETKRQNDALVVQQAFASSRKDLVSSNTKARSYNYKVGEVSPASDHNVVVPHFPQLQRHTRTLTLRVASMCKLLRFTNLFNSSLLLMQLPRMFDKQGAQLIALTMLVFSRTWVSDSIASLNGTIVKYVMEQDKASFIRLIGVSVRQSAASSFIALSIRHLKAHMAIGWRTQLTQHLLKAYLRNNAFYKVFHLSSSSIDADQRLTHDLKKLTTDMSGLVTGMVKPSVDIIWFTWRMKLLTGKRGVAILYAYMLLGLGFLRTVAPDLSDLTSGEQELEGTFRSMHERLRTHAESIAFFGGGKREKAMIESKFMELLHHSMVLLKKKWVFGILDGFVTKQLPHNVTWGLSLLYALEHKGDQELMSIQGDLAHALRFLASVVSQSFLAFGNILELHGKFLELSGGINRIFEVEDLLHSIHADASSKSTKNDLHSGKAISFSKVDIISPAQKMLARQLTCDIVPGESLLVTGPNGSGKSSIFRVLRGLWPVLSGSLAKPYKDISEESEYGCGIFYISQKPYTCLGTLRDQIIYPLSHEEAQLRMFKLYGRGKISADATSILDSHLTTVLESVCLSYLLEREGGWDATLNWEYVLSLGEQQRLGMARLFFHKPQFGILDECTNATSVDVEEHLYRVGQDMGITFVTSSQRPALIPFHSSELRLIDGKGNWELLLIEK